MNAADQLASIDIKKNREAITCRLDQSQIMAVISQKIIEMAAIPGGWNTEVAITVVREGEGEYFLRATVTSMRSKP